MLEKKCVKLNPQIDLLMLMSSKRIVHIGLKFFGLNS